MSTGKGKPKAATKDTPDAIAIDQRAFLRIEARPVNADEYPMICCGCSAYIVASEKQARERGWKLWVGGAWCNACLVKAAKDEGQTPMDEPAPLTAAEVAKFRKQITTDDEHRLLVAAEKQLRNLGCCCAMVGERAKAREIGRMAERLWSMTKGDG